MPEELLPTRKTLLSRLKNWQDQDSWKTFFDTYWQLIYTTATRAGLTDAEAQDVVQETILSLAKKLPDFKYDPAKGSFKNWLLTLTKWRIVGQFRKRGRLVPMHRHESQTRTGTTEMERVPDPAGLALEQVWDEEWEKNLLDAALTRIKKKVDSKHFQIFDLCVNKKLPVASVARALKVNRGQVYLVRHRIGNLLKAEVAKLESKPI